MCVEVQSVNPLQWTPQSSASTKLQPSSRCKSSGTVQHQQQSQQGVTVKVGGYFVSPLLSAQ
jgi:hypothetical protein